MSEKEKKTIEEISKAVSGMTEAEKARFLGIAEGMSIMNQQEERAYARRVSGALHEKSGAAENGKSADRKRSPEPGDHVRTGGRSPES